jgi:hypothetical protein
MAKLSSALAIAAAALALPNAAAFFPPQPNNEPSLTPGPREPAPAQPLAAPAPGQPPLKAPAQVQRQTPPPDPAEAIRAAEEQMDRVERESERARASQYPAPVQGAFDGLTSERDR